MGVNFALLVQTAVGVAKQVGATAQATIARATVPNPLTGTVTGSPITQTVDVIQADARKYAKASDAAWTQVRTVLFLSARQATFTPQVGDAVTWAGRTGRLVALEEYTPAGAVIGWFVGVGA